MTRFVILAVVLVAAAAQETEPWTGPIADHVLGQLVADTPEVAAAKAAHAKSHVYYQSILPKLPEEEVFPENKLGHVQNVQQSFVQPAQHLQNFVPQAVRNEPIILTATGETPEVYAARIEHLKLVDQVRATAPHQKTNDVHLLSNLLPQPQPHLQHIQHTMTKSIPIELVKPLVDYYHNVN